MPTRLLVALVLLIAAPLLALGWFSTAAIADQDNRAQESLRAIVSQRLSEFAAPVNTMLNELQIQLAAAARAGNDRAATLASLRLHHPLVRQTVWIDRQGLILYPQRTLTLSPQQESEFQWLEKMVQGRSLTNLITSPTTDNSPQQSLNSNPSSQKPHWGTWYMEQGLQIILWIPGDRGDWMGILLNRSAWMSELIARLPDSGISDSKSLSSLADAGRPVDSRTMLVDAEEHRIYQWNTPSSHAATSLPAFEEDATWFTVASVPLPSPLSGWKLQFETQQSVMASVSSSLPILLALLGLGILLLSLGIYIATSLQRQLRLATQQVSFSSQVSHELRTPLTNIQLYTEMAESDLRSLPASPQAATLAMRLQVIGLESQRLSRLCDNVLALVRKPHKLSQHRISACNPNQLIQDCLEPFQPSFQRLEFEIVQNLQTDSTVRLDQHALETVLMNLLSNVERYAAEGRRLEIHSELCGASCGASCGNSCGNSCGAWLRVRVSDHGPGIPKRHWKRVFQPFVRLNTGINAPNGTGIGLSIANQVTRQAGGNLQIVAANKGTTVELNLPIDGEVDS